MERIEEEEGEIVPAVVVNAAAPADAPLHPAFEWDNRKAGNEFRLIQARNLIRSVHVVSEGREDEGSAWVHVAVEEGRSYRSVAKVVLDDDLYESAVTELLAKLQMAAKALQNLEGVASRAQRKQIMPGRRLFGKALKMLTQIAGA